uniref:Serine aminopeptidase S33 domain-containing protein n=1 Tax=Kalanchoe fedtschenkoi TaxID=63787 RepID=A0A7N0V7E7_KALFE
MAAAKDAALTSGATGQIVLIVRSLKTSARYPYHSLIRSFVFLQTVLLSLRFLLRRRRFEGCGSLVRRRAKEEEADVARRRALAESVAMVAEEEDRGRNCGCRWRTELFYGVRNNALFCRSWLPASPGEVRGVLIIIHGLNEHSGRYTQFAKQLTDCHYGVYAMDWIGHGGSDGLHGYVPSLDHVVADTGAFLEKIKAENPGVPCFLFGHSTGGAVVLKAACYPHIKKMLEGIILTSPALRVKPAHPIVGAVAPLVSLVVPKLQFKGANRKGIPVSRDPTALAAKYSDPLVYTGPIRARTGHEILRICSYLMRNLKSVSVPFLVLHGTADKVTDPLASQDLYRKASSTFKDIKLYEGFLHDLLFEPEREEIGQDIINWMGKRLSSARLDNTISSTG